MSNRFVRSSKFRHVFGTAAKPEKCFQDVRISKGPHESNMSAVNCKFLAVVLEAQGGGSFIVLQPSHPVRVTQDHPKVGGHTKPVLDVAWNPFNDNMIASASEDCTIKLWDIPDGGLTKNMTADDSILTLEGHQRKVQHLQWHPSAENVLMSAGADNILFVWNVGTGEVLVEITVHPDMIFSISWDYNGSRIATTCKDKKIRVFDARSGDVLQEGKGHEGTKPSRVVFCGQRNRLFTTGFSRSSERQFALWNPEALDQALVTENIDQASGVLFPFWDEGTHMVYLVGKGDSQIRYFEVDEHDKVHFLSMYQTNIPGRSVCAMPKKDLDYMKCEVMRFFKLQHTKSIVEPTSMTVPRKADTFQDDIFPPCPSGEPALTAEEWLDGTDADPKLKSFVEGVTVASTGPKRAVASARKVTAKQPAPAKQSPASSSEPVSNLAGRPEPTTLEEYRKAYKELEEENRKLRAKLGM